MGIGEDIKLTRRKFLQGAAAAGAVAAVGGIELAAKADGEPNPKEELKYVRTTCAPNCTSSKSFRRRTMRTRSTIPADV